MPESTYSPRLRTGVILCGTGTAGAYQAGVLRALVEAGIKVDVIAAHGAGVMTALAASIDGGAKIWDPKGPWASPGLRHAYRWRLGLRVAAFGLAATALGLLLPLLLLVVAAATYAAAGLAALVSATSASSRLIAFYRLIVERAFDPTALPTILPRLVVLAVLFIVGLLVVTAIVGARAERSRRRMTGAFWWRLVGYPLDAREPGATLIDALWQLVKGASNDAKPTPAEIGRRYVEVLSDNFGQPGFFEVVLAVHDVDSRRDIVGSVLTASSRSLFEGRPAVSGPREAEVVDFTGPQRELLVDFLQGALRLPIVTAPAVLQFPMESYWRGERHRLCDRPELTLRLVDELAAIGVEQVILVSPAAAPAVPHAMRGRPIDLRARVGEIVRSVETAALHTTCAAASNRFSGVFAIHPDHNPIGPFDFGGAYDEASDRHRTLVELIEQGYADAYRHFIEPIVATGEVLTDEIQH